MAQRGAFEGVDAALMVHPAGLDLARFAAWSLLAASMFRHRTLPACLLMVDLAARAGQLTFADPLLLPSLLTIGGMTARALLARVNAMTSD